MPVKSFVQNNLTFLIELTKRSKHAIISVHPPEQAENKSRNGVTWYEHTGEVLNALYGL